MVFNASSSYLKLPSPYHILENQIEFNTPITDRETEDQRAQVTWKGGSVEAGLLSASGLLCP